MATDPVHVPLSSSTSTSASGSEDVWDSLTVQGETLARLLANEALSDSTKDFLGGLEENCRRVLATEDVVLDVIKFTQRELTEFLKGKNDLTYSNLVKEVCQRLRTLDPILRERLQDDRIWNNAVGSLVEDYGTRILDIGRNHADDGHAHSHQIYEALSKLVEARCHMTLQANGSTDPDAILHQVSSRAKDLESLGDKAKKASKRLLKEAIFDVGKELRGTLSEQEAEAKRRLINKIDDIAGARILVYFPDDVPKIVDKINQDPALDIDHSTISFTKSRTDHRQQDNDAINDAHARGHGEHLGMLNISDGAFLSERTTIDDIPRRWRHSGYRAVHLTVSLTKRMAEEFNAQGDSIIEGPGQHTQDSNGVESTHPQSDNVRADTPMQEYITKLAEIKRKYPRIKPIHLMGKKVEIQITSVVMHAWSQVEHDIIYKNPLGIPINGSMTRMLDAINGQSITSEGLLQELRKATEGLQSSMDETITSSGHLRGLLEKTRLQEATDFNQRPDIYWTEVLFAVALLLTLERPANELSDKMIPDSPSGFSMRWLYQFIPSNATTSVNSREKPDLALAILRNIALKVKTSFDSSSVAKTCTSHGSQTSSGSHSRACMMLTLVRFTNAFSLMIVIDVVAVWESLENGTSPWGTCFDLDALVDKLLQIQHVLEGERQPSIDELKDLVAFAQVFLIHPRSAVHDAVVSLTNIGCFLTKVSGWPWIDRGPWSSKINQPLPPSLNSLVVRWMPLKFGNCDFIEGAKGTTIRANIRTNPYFEAKGYCTIAIPDAQIYRGWASKGCHCYKLFYYGKADRHPDDFTFRQHEK